MRRHCIADSPPDAQRHIVLIAHSRGGNVARFGLLALRKAFGKQGWTFAAVTLGSPHLGTHVFERVGHRWHGLAAAVGGLRHLGAPWMNRDTLAELVNLERGLAYDVPPGFHDVEPAGVDRMMRGRPATELPEGMWLVGSHWGPGSGVDEKAWDWLFEDVLGAEEEGDGLVRRLSALGGRAAENDAMRARRRVPGAVRRVAGVPHALPGARADALADRPHAGERAGVGASGLILVGGSVWLSGLGYGSCWRRRRGRTAAASRRGWLRGGPRSRSTPVRGRVGARAELAARCALRSDRPLRVSSRSALRAPPPPCGSCALEHPRRDAAGARQ